MRSLCNINKNSFPETEAFLEAKLLMEDFIKSGGRITPEGPLIYFSLSIETNNKCREILDRLRSTEEGISLISSAIRNANKPLLSVIK